MEFGGGTNITDCSHYMSLILWEYGFTSPFIRDYEHEYNYNRTTEAVNDQLMAEDFDAMYTHGYNFGMEVNPIYGWKDSYGTIYIEPGDIVYMENDGFPHVQMYAGNNRWYNAGADAYLSDSIGTEREAPYHNDVNPAYNKIRGVVRLQNEWFSYEQMEYIFKTYNSKAWNECYEKIYDKKYWLGDDQAVLYTIISLARTRGILTNDWGETGWNNYWVWVNRHY